jgi:hypothetical protein
MTDYYSIISRAIGTLDSNAREARLRLYGRARTALLAEIRRAYPPLDQPDIMATRKSLEVAIGKVEAQAQREQRAHQEPADAAPVIVTASTVSAGESRGMLNVQGHNG